MTGCYGLRSLEAHRLLIHISGEVVRSMYRLQNSSAFVLTLVIAIHFLTSCESTSHSNNSSRENFTEYGNVTKKNAPSRSRVSEPKLLEPEEGTDEKLKDFDVEVAKIIETLPKSGRVLVSKISVELIELRGRTYPEVQKAYESVAEETRNKIESLLINSGRTVIDRTALKEAHREIGFTYSGMVDDAQMIRIGKMAGATHLTTGKVIITSGDAAPGLPQHIHQFSVKFIDLESMTVIGNAAVSFTLQSPNLRY